MPQIQVTLGDVTFQDMEVPEVIPWGGEQALVIQKLVGGQRVIDAMGRDDMPLAWEGIFLYEGAVQRARSLDAYRIAAPALTLTWDQLNFTVVVKRFKADYTNPYKIPYTISCEVVQDNATPTTPDSTTDVDTQMDNDLTTAQGLSTTISDPTLTGLMATVTSAVSAVSTFVNANPAVIIGVTTAIAAAQGQVGVLLASQVASTTGITAVGGVLPGVPPLQNVAALNAQVTDFGEGPPLIAMQGVLGRMNANAVSVSNNTSILNTAGGDLRDIAANQYGDATSWTGIAKANGLTDPQLQGIQSLTIPNTADTAGGLLGV